MRKGDEAIDLYMKKIYKIPLITEEEQRTLFAKLKSGDKKAKQRLIEGNLSLVVKIARKYYYPDMGLEFLDLVEEGNIGLSNAVERFDPDRGVKISTYASWWVEKHFQEASTGNRQTPRH